MKIENIKNINIEIEGKSFNFSYEELANIEVSLSDNEATITIKPNGYEASESPE